MGFVGVIREGWSREQAERRFLRRRRWRWGWNWCGRWQLLQPSSRSSCVHSRLSHDELEPSYSRLSPAGHGYSPAGVRLHSSLVQLILVLLLKLADGCYRPPTEGSLVNPVAGHRQLPLGFSRRQLLVSRRISRRRISPDTRTPASWTVHMTAQPMLGSHRRSDQLDQARSSDRGLVWIGRGDLPWSASYQGRSDGGGYRYLYSPKSAQVNFLYGVKMTSERLFNSFIPPKNL